MSTARQTTIKKAAPISQKRPHSLDIASKGIHTGQDFAGLMSALMTDLIEGNITPAIGNATCNAGGKLLKVVDLQYRYGSTIPGHPTKVLVLTGTLSEIPAEPVAGKASA